MAGSGSPANFSNYQNYYSSLQQIFLSRLLTRQSDVTVAIMTLIDKDLDITNTMDPECKHLWFPLGIMLGYAPTTEAAHTFISSMGRMKYLMPIYQALLDSNQKDVAVKWYNENINFYHPYAVNKLAKMIGITTDQHQTMLDNIEAQKKVEMTFLQE